MLTIAHFLKPEPGMSHRDVDGIWDDGPLPNWALAFQPHDPITQAFDEEAQSMYESSHAPAWIESFDPTDVSGVRRVLTHGQRLVAINRELVTLSGRAGPSAFVTKHSVAVDPSGVPSLGAGSALQEGDLLMLCTQLRGALPIEFLSSNVLVRSEDSIT